MFKPIEYSKGRFCKINNDTRGFKKGILEETLEFLKNSPDEDFVFFLNASLPTDDKFVRCYTFDDVTRVVSYYQTWIGGVCINRETFNNMEDPLRYSKLRFPTADIMARLTEEGKSVLVYNVSQFEQHLPPKKGAQYNCAEAFGRDYFYVLEKHLNKHNGLTRKTFEEEKRKTLDHTNFFYFDLTNEYRFQRTGYLKFMLKYYKFNLYFYKKLLKYLFKFYIYNRGICQDDTVVRYKILGHYFDKIKDREKYWRRANKHNQTKLLTKDLCKKVFVGKNTRGNIEILGDNEAQNCIRIGNFCTIKDGAKFILSSLNNYENYPDVIGSSVLEDSIISFKDTNIKDDVWIGENSLIYQGVTVNKGAVIMPGAVVKEDIPPYAVVEGNPAVIKKYRFNDSVIEKLLRIDYSKIEESDINILSKYVNEENLKKAEERINEK